jgi:hypothetical protein
MALSSALPLSSIFLHILDICENAARDCQLLTPSAFPWGLGQQGKDLGGRTSLNQRQAVTNHRLTPTRISHVFLSRAMLAHSPFLLDKHLGVIVPSFVYSSDSWLSLLCLSDYRKISKKFRKYTK